MNRILDIVSTEIELSYLGYTPRSSIINEIYTSWFIIRRMQAEELEAYSKLQKKGAFWLQSPRVGMVVVSAKLPNLMLMFPVEIPVKIS